MPSLFAEFGGARFHYRIDGAADAPTVVLSNSLGTDLTMWEPQVPELLREFRVLRYDARGHGQSSASPGPYTIEQLARDVLGLMDVAGVERAHFCGLSMGGMAGVWLGIHAGWRVERLVLADTAPRIGPADVWNTRIAKVRAGGMSAIAPAVLERWFTPAFIASRPDAVAPVRAALEQSDPAGYVAACAAVRDMDLRSEVPRITRRTLVITGTHDVVTPPAEARALAAAIPGARYVELPAAHISNIEDAAGFNAALLDFLAI